MTDYQNNESGAEEAVEGQDGAADVSLEEGFVEERSTAGRNAGMLLAGFAILGAGVIYFMRAKAGPAAAMASKEMAVADKTINEFLKDGNQNIKKMNDLLHNTQQFVQVFKTHEGKPQVKVDDLMTNPFQFEPPKPDLTDEQIRELKAAEEAKERARIQAKFDEDTNSFRVGFILSGKKPSCMINQKMYTEGQEIANGILVQKINADGVILVRGEHTKVLKASK
jgi:hypothetical protein